MTFNINPCQELLNYDVRMRSLDYHLTVLSQDLHLKDAGWKINCAVDTFDIFSYAFSYHNLLAGNKFKEFSSERRRQIVGRHIPRQIIFKDENLSKDIFDSIILLPPYQEELTLLTNNQDNIYRANLQFNRLRELYKPGSNCYNILNECIIDSNDNQNVEKAATYLQKHFSELLFLRLSTKEIGIENLIKVFQNKKCSDKLKNLIDNLQNYFSIQGIMNCAWFPVYQEIRRKHLCDLRDTEAIMDVFKLNKDLESLNKVLESEENEVVLLFSGAPTTARVLNYDKMDRFLPKNVLTNLENQYLKSYIPYPLDETKEYRLLRTTKTYLYYANFFKDTEKDVDINETLENIDNHLKDIELHRSGVSFKSIKTIRQNIIDSGCEYYDLLTGRIINSVKPKCKDCDIMQLSNETFNKLQQDKVISKELRNINLYMNKNIYLKDEKLLSIDDIQPTLIGDILSVVKDFIEFLDGKNESINSILSKNQKNLNILRSQLWKDLPVNTFEDIGFLSYNSDLLWRIFNRVDFQDKPISYYVDLYCREYISEEKQEKTLKDILAKLMEISQRNDSIESRLLLASIAYSWREFEFCFEIVSSLSISPNHYNYLGSQYLRTLSRFEIGKSRGEEESINRSIKRAVTLVRDFPKDPRMHYLLGLIEMNSMIISQKYVFQPLDHYRNTLRLLNSTDNKIESKSKNLRFSTLNNMAYYIYKFDVTGEEKLIRDIYDEFIIDNSVINTHPNYFDTLGCIEYILSLDYDIDIEQQIEFLNKAHENILKAIDKLEKMFGPKQKMRIFESNLQRVTERLRQLKSDSGASQ